MRSMASLAVAVAVLSACSGSGEAGPPPVAAGSTTTVLLDPLAGVPECADLIGKTLTPAIAAGGCRVGQRLELFGGPTCTDGRRLEWNNFGWGYVGEVYVAHKPGAERVAPLAERDACN